MPTSESAQGAAGESVGDNNPPGAVPEPAMTAPVHHRQSEPGTRTVLARHRTTMSGFDTDAASCARPAPPNRRPLTRHSPPGRSRGRALLGFGGRLDGPALLNLAPTVVVRADLA